MAKISNKDIAEAIYLSLKDKHKAEQITTLGKIAQFLDRRHFLSRAKEILIELDKTINRAEDRVVVEIESAVALEDRVKAKALEVLKKYYSLDKIALVETLNADLIGGMKIRINDEVIDLSIRNKINLLKEHLTQPTGLTL